MDSRNRQTSTAIRAEPGDRPLRLVAPPSASSRSHRSVAVTASRRRGCRMCPATSSIEALRCVLFARTFTGTVSHYDGDASGGDRAAQSVQPVNPRTNLP